MKNVLLSLGLLFSIVSFAQTPFVSCFGETASINKWTDFTRLGDGEYLLYAHGNHEEPDAFDVRTYRLAVPSGGLTDEWTTLPGINQSLFKIQEDGRGGAIACGSSKVSPMDNSDVVIHYLAATGKVTHSHTFGTEMEEHPIQTGIDEQQNYFIAYYQATTKYYRYHSSRVRCFDSEGGMIYDVDLAYAEGLLFDLVPLGNGEIVVIGTNKTAADAYEVEVIKLGAEGTVHWRKRWSYPDVLTITRGFLEGKVLYLIDYMTQKIISLDTQTGEILTDLAFPRELRGDFLYPFVKYRDDFWIISRKNIYQLAIKKYGYKLVETYPLDAGIINSVRYYPEGAWEYLYHDGKLVRFDMTTTRFTTLAKGGLATQQDIREEVVDVELVNNKIITGVKKMTGGTGTVTIQELSFDGEIQGSVTNEASQHMLTNSPLAILEDGGFASAKVAVDENYLSALNLEIYGVRGELSQEVRLLEKAAQIIDDVQVVALTGNKIAAYGHYKNIRERTEGHLLCEVDLANPALKRTQFFDFTGRDQQLFGLQEGTVGLLSSLSDHDLTVRKLSLEDGLLWETTKSFSELIDPKIYSNPVSYTNLRSKLAAAPGSEDVLLGINIQSGGDPPVYHLVSFGPNGEIMQHFSSKHIHFNAGTDFLNDNQVVIVGCGWNTLANSEGGPYQLTFEVYDLSGALVREVIRPVASPIVVTNVEVLDNGFIAAYGSILSNTDTDAIIILMNKSGDIVKGLECIASE